MPDSAHYLTLKAGPAARAALGERALTPERVGAVAGAAGGPKWLTIAAFYRALFADWFAARADALPIVGSSIGAWAGAAACHPDDAGGAIDALTEAYIGQRYSAKPDAAEITNTLAGILDTVLTPEVRRGILTHPRYRLHALTVRSRWSTATDRRLPLALGTVAAGLGNTASRRWLGAFFERVVFARDGEALVYAADGIASRSVALAEDNLRDAIFASGNVPLIMQAVRDPAGAPPGLYRDGGLTDYHIDQPLLVKDATAPIVLMPHFDTKLVPGWLDKRLAWRRPRYADHVLLVGPGPALMDRLVDGRVPERRDFYRYAGADTARERAWRQAVDAGCFMRDAFFDLAASGRLIDHVEPL
ncbi:patatin-like phospholipase family protein [Salinisphaera sp.]|uniref:patatin-like phospholipase family protein n=1 Tax=Salinisphaera sp. TaxID=1914330 RepID=UPI002D7A3F65|nr:patatin-like phospholipase family protein [Salinisphaera sp.]HET7313698.1 patatin-like phospholipase family protein [Salinisphaera sp.]